MEKQQKDTVGLQPTEPNTLYQKPTNRARKIFRLTIEGKGPYDIARMQKRSCCRRSTDWRKRRPETESRSAKPEREGSFRRARFWKRYCRKCGR